jgi:phosphoserine phosphatase
MIMKTAKPIVVFDMDGVLVHERSSWRIIHEAVGTSNEHSFQAYIRGEIDDEEFMERDIRLWIDMGIVNISQIRELLDRVDLMSGFHHCFEALNERGVELAILSGGIDILADRLGKEGGFNLMMANGIEIDKEGRLTGSGILNVPLREKGSVLRSLIDRGGMIGPVIVVGDSAVDITMFENADLSIAFRPETEMVADKADIVVNEPDLSKVSDRIIGYLRES